ncbi:MAG: GFA family protein [Gammaproteobacteria bacterium]|nr:GFA family protein [Gammaproteobacteria bacterium]
MPLIQGGCFCGAIRFSIDAPESHACICYCHSCQRSAGAPCVAWATYEKDTLKIVQGVVHSHRSSPGVSRGLCSACGTCISYENEERPGEIDLSLNALDDPAAPVLRAHIWTEDKQPWTVICDDLPVFTRNSQ